MGVAIYNHVIKCSESTQRYTAWSLNRNRDIRCIESVTRILVVRFSSIGDIVLISPVIRALKTQLEGEVVIDCITKKAFASIFESSPYVDHVIGIDNNVSEVKDQLLDNAYDYVIDLHNNLRSKQVKRYAKALSFTIDKRNVAKWIYVQTKKERMPIGHVVARSLETVQALGVDNDGKGLDFFIPSEVKMPNLPEAFNAGFISYVIGGRQPGKLLPVEKAIELCNRISKPIVLLGGKEDFERGEQIKANSKAVIFNACGQFSLMESARCLEQSDKVLTHDTGLMHIATALNKPVYSMWFATTPELGFSPWYPHAESKIFESKSGKRPTSKLGNRGASNPEIFNVDLDEIAKDLNA